MQAGFSEVDITPRVGVQLAGFGPYLNRYSIGVRDPLKARAVAFELAGEKAILISCDLIGLGADIAAPIKPEISRQTGVPVERIMLHCTHTHSGPNASGLLHGWGDPDVPYLAVLPGRIVQAGVTAWQRLTPAVLALANVSCEGIGLNREYDQDAPPLEDVLRDDWRPAKPELTDTKCQVLKLTVEKDGALLGFMAYFGCHPVVCCQTTRYIHGDFAGVAMNLLERENPGSVGLFLQGAQGDVNSCVVHKPEPEALLALDVIAARFANAVRQGLLTATPTPVATLRGDDSIVKISSRPLSLAQLQDMLTEKERILTAPGATDNDCELRMAAVAASALRLMLSRLEQGENLSFQPAEIQGLRLGPVALLGSPFEIMQAIKNDVVAAASSPIPLVMGLTNGSMGYAPDKTMAARGGYAADWVPLICGRMPYADIHTELAAALLDLDRRLNA